MIRRYAIIVLLICIVGLSISIVHGQNSLASGYRITTDHHGKNVIFGETVTAWADTTDLTTYEVVFDWKWGGSETPKRTITVATFITWYTGVDGWPEMPAVPHGTEVRRFTDSYEPDEFGEWAVKATFINDYGHTVASENDSFPVRATSFKVIPEVPLGTVAIVISMFAGMGLFVMRRKKTLVPT